jgi:putative acetyltransferase
MLDWLTLFSVRYDAYSSEKLHPVDGNPGAGIGCASAVIAISETLPQLRERLMGVLSNTEILVTPAESSHEMAQIRELFTEYAESLGFSLCFQDFDREVAGLPGDYGPPDGRLLLARYGSEAAGCIALHSLDRESLEPDVCEMKRLYVRPQFRGRSVGRLLAERVIAEAKSIGYTKMRLDTVEPKMKNAVALYRALGFREIGAYRPNPIEGAMYMELGL